MTTEQPMQWEAPPGTYPAADAAAPPPPAIRYGGFWRRFVAYMADSFILSLLFIPGMVALLLAPDSIFPAVLLIVGAIATFAYFPFFWARSGSTPAMAALGLRIERENNGQVISGWRAVGRYLALGLVSIPLYLGLIWAAFERRKRGWHDMLAGTVVIRIPAASRRQRIATWVAAGLGLLATVAFIAISTVVYTLAALGPGLGQDAPGFDGGAPPIEAPTQMAFANLRIGNCFNPTQDFLDVRVEAVPCDDPHLYELVAVRELPPGEYPATVAAQDEIATSACQQPVLRYVGLARLEATYISYIGLYEPEWLAGDRRVWCIVHNEFITTVEGSARDGWR